MKTILLRVPVPVKKPFLILLLSCIHFFSFSQLSIDYGKSFVNVSKGLAGGTIEPGDTLEVRATFVVKGGTANDYVDSCAFFDVVPLNTSYIPGTLAILTNEGKIYKSFTDAQGDDPGWISGSNIQINMGYKTAPIATWSERGRIKYSDKPSFYGSSCIMVASYRVRVTGAYGSKINIGGGSISYYPYHASLTAINFNKDSIMIFQNYGICTNAGTNAITSEFGGTFGSGKAKNRGSSSKVSNNYTYTNFGANSPNDYYYGVSNNTSTGGVGYTTSNAWPIPDANLVAFPGPAQSHRVFNVWDIIGDHTGAASPTAGNPPTDTVNGTGGYMVVINSSYKTDTAFLDTVKNLCPNTYYQYYAWFRNICSHCGCDSNGKGPGAGYIPTGPGDSSGVHPNMTFSINGFDYYTTGNILYTGQWVKKGFTYLTGPAETSMVINIRNNAPGAGGNDWAIDDIGVANCTPNISLTPNKPDTLCQGADDTVRFMVSAFFSNFTEWKLEKSVDGGITWATPGLDTLSQASTGSAVPVFNPVSGNYEYIVTRYYRLNLVDTKVIYRLTIASTVANLSNSNCSFTTTSPKIIYAVNCMIILPTSITLRGEVKENMGSLTWISSNETGNIRYVIERSTDQQNFQTIGNVNGRALPGGGDAYNFTDPSPVAGPTYYRIIITDNTARKNSNMVLLSNTSFSFDIKSLVNPFSNMLSFDMIVPDDQMATFILNDTYGRTVKIERQQVYAGLNSIKIYGLENLQSGAYILRVYYEDKSVNKWLLKINK